jgi:hypothetical protein
VTPDVASYTKVKAFLQECMDVDGVEDESQLLSAFKKYREIMHVFVLRAKVTETQQELQDAVDVANPILGGVLAAADVGTSRRTGKSNPDRRRRNRDKWMKERQSESASIHHPSSHNVPPKKPRLDHDLFDMPRHLCKATIINFYHSHAISGIAKIVLTMVHIFTHLPWQDD